MTDHLSPDKTIVVLEALYAGIEVEFGDRAYRLMADRKGRPCIAAEIVFEDEDEEGQDIEVEGHIEVDFDLGDFLKECERLDERYLVDLAHRTALVKVRRR